MKPRCLGCGIETITPEPKGGIALLCDRCREIADSLKEPKEIYAAESNQTESVGPETYNVDQDG